MSTITIDGPQVERADGSVRCVGCGVDKDGQVTGRFALPQGHEWVCPDATVAVEFVESMDGLPSIDGTYREQP